MSVFVYKGPQALSIFVYTYLIIQELLYIPAKIAGVFFTGFCALTLEIDKRGVYNGKK
jgi:hypothetical protein